jgi:hypothetical protein
MAGRCFALEFTDLPDGLFGRNSPMKLITGVIIVLIALLRSSASGEDRKGGDLLRRTDLYRMILRDGSWLVVNSPFPSDEKRMQTLEVRVNLYPQEVEEEKRTDECLWVADRVTTVEYVPGNELYYVLAKETDDHILLFFTWNAQHCTIDTQTGRVLNRAKGDDVLKTWGKVLPLKLSIWRRAISRPATSTSDSDLFGPVDSQ